MVLFKLCVIYMPPLFFYKKCYVFASQMEPSHSLFQKLCTCNCKEINVKEMT